MAIRPIARPGIPPLENGDRLERAEYHRRYLAMPPQVHAELIDGVVYLASPVSIAAHGRPHSALVGWLMAYVSGRDDVDIGDNTTILLHNDNEPQPDALLRFFDGQSSVSAEGYVVGAPELVAEVAASSASYDMHVKKEMYRVAGCREYLVWRVWDAALDWFILRDGAYELLQPDERGIVVSETFPGLRLDVPALLAGNFAAVLHGQLAANDA